MFAMLECCLPNFSCIVGRMDKHRDWGRLAERARTARGSRSQKAIAAAGGPSHTTLGKIERAEWRPTRGVDDTIDKLEKVYEWAPGSVDTILNGGDAASALDASECDHSIDTANDEDEFTIDDERELLEQSWSRVMRLAAAVLGTVDASEELRAATRDVVFDVSGHLIIRILSGEFARRLEGWLARIYTERARMWRELSTGEPVFPWYTEPKSVGSGGSGDEGYDRAPRFTAPPTGFTADGATVLGHQKRDERDQRRGG